MVMKLSLKWIVFILFYMVNLGGYAMSQQNEEPIELKWEWPGDRKPDYRILIQVKDLIEKQKGLLSFFNKSPSIASNFPDPIYLHGTVIESDQPWKGNVVKLLLPKVEISKAKIENLVALGITSTGVCICVEKLPMSLKEEEAHDWLMAWDCQSK